MKMGAVTVVGLVGLGRAIGEKATVLPRTLEVTERHGTWWSRKPGIENRLPNVN